MDARHEGQQVSATADVRDRFGQPGTSAPERVLGGREPHFASTLARSICVRLTRRGPRSPRSADDSVVKCYRKLPVWRSQTRYWPGIGGWSQANLTAQNIAPI